jgi:hypothetical protein
LYLPSRRLTIRLKMEVRRRAAQNRLAIIWDLV